ncbi:TIR domain-containing protein [Vibrio ezurae]|uniref:Thoeris protein ThsB TIR-like domain-containing protein n=1 Tax=Vibrio ezurae NBRC 102218 TaxID=1219080 RepID=U3B0G7_9VIBR|nr:hypothetical protein VEZ01S_16_00240 [Vibrio ezurae NBRC 102218]
MVSVQESLTPLGKPYIDLIHNDSLDKQARVEHELTQSDIVLLLNSASIQSSPWVRWEIDTAEQLGIPVKRVDISGVAPTYKDMLSVIEG